MHNSVTDGALEHLTSTVAERMTRSEAAIRHARAALRMGKVAEALVVLEASADGDHLSWSRVNQLTKVKEAAMLSAAEKQDEQNLLRSYEAQMRG